MTWLIGCLLIFGVVIALVKGAKPGSQTVRQTVRHAQTRTLTLSADEKKSLSGDLRQLALTQYDMAFSKAEDAGKDRVFSHQVGVLRSVSAALVNGEHVSKHQMSQLQMETVPFNRIAPEIGREAVAEYLVWMFFPDFADEHAFVPALSRFYEEMRAESQKTDDPFDFMLSMIYVQKCDWQKYIANRIAPAGA